MTEIRQSRFGAMVVVETDQFQGRRYRCPCGWEGWTAWGHAIRHAQSCDRAAYDSAPSEPGGD